MSAYKKLNKQDIFTTTYNAHKKWEIAGSDLDIHNITVYRVQGRYVNSIKQLYFPQYVTEEISSQNLQILSQSFDTFDQTTLHLSGSKQFTGNGTIISIPQELYGNNIHNDQSVRLEYTAGNYLEDEPDYWGYDYTLPTPLGTGYVSDGYWQDQYAPFTDTFGVIVDDGEGNLYYEGSEPRQYAGYINYSHGLIYVADPIYRNLTLNVLIFKSSQTIYTHNINCKLRDFEFNYSTNPSTYNKTVQTTYDNNGDIYQQTGNVFLGDLKSNVTGSTFSPYITTVGLYNDANQLIAVGKVSRPLPKSLETETTIVVKLDI